MGIFDGLGKFGLGDLQETDLFEEEKKADDTASVEERQKNSEEIEAEMLIDKKFKCPQCDKQFTSKIVRSGKARLLSQDIDLRPRHEGINTVKYDVIMCPHCGYAALNKFFNAVTSAQLKLIKENISLKFQPKEFSGSVYDYDQAMERYQMALINAIIKKAKNSEKAFICLKSSWVVAGKIESLDENENQEEITKLRAQEAELLKNAFEGFAKARSTESYPMCGMDEYTVDYLIAVLAYRNHQDDIAMRMLSSVITGRNANPRLKDKARDLKEEIVQEKKKKES